MKKQYIRPQALTLTFSTEGMLAASLINTYDSDGTNDTGGSEALSNGKGWNCNNWTESED